MSRESLLNRNEVGMGLIASGLLAMDAFTGFTITRALSEIPEGLVSLGEGIYDTVSDHVGGEAESGTLGPFATVPEAIVIPVDTTAPLQ